MSTVAMIWVGLIGLLHVRILVIEMFQWGTPKTNAIFGVPKEFSSQPMTAVMAANQGLYNGFLAAGLFWGLAHPDAAVGEQIQLFFLACVLVAGLYGAYSASKRILFVQAVPALIGIGLVLAA